MTDTEFEVIGVYHADGGLLGELSYVTKKLLGLTSCALCDLSHGWVMEKPAVRAWRCRLSFAFSFLHLNEINSMTADVVKGHTPCIVIRDHQGVRVLISRDELAAMDGDELRLFARLDELINSI